MESKKIENLLEQYLDGATSLAEEKRLQRFFTSGKVPPHLQQYVPMFTYFSQSRDNRFSGEVKFPGKKKIVYRWVAIAAAVVVLFGLIIEQDNRLNEFGTYEDPELALQKTKEALNMVSGYLNTGTKELGYLQEFNKTTNKLIKKP